MTLRLGHCQILRESLKIRGWKLAGASGEKCPVQIRIYRQVRPYEIERGFVLDVEQGTMVWYKSLFNF
jgi:hypothetical protein